MMTNCASWRFGWLASWVAVMAGLCMLMSGCAGTSKSTKSAVPREAVHPGQAVGGRVAVVYSPSYEINLGGLEKLHSFDIHKYRRIHSALVLFIIMTAKMFSSVSGIGGSNRMRRTARPSSLTRKGL